jgi:hypothetical protein
LGAGDEGGKGRGQDCGENQAVGWHEEDCVMECG